MQHLNFWRKCDAAAVTVDLSHLPNKNSSIQQAKIIMTRLFCEEDESLFNSLHSEEESAETLEEKSLTLYEKLEKAIHSKTKVMKPSGTPDEAARNGLPSTIAEVNTWRERSSLNRPVTKYPRFKRNYTMKNIYRLFFSKNEKTAHLIQSVQFTERESNKVLTILVA
ncbi:hypothetical protein AVEN_167204-1 [Araneus ventricosus]|uniref:Uncharacterized protein n=1 Tax=Araneus ventricosus TaxID=182803 RepID=A0A4Y2M804_ARAVE|nr:hypothetical protein AVEN_167204-1 [Araneus ventricosus]